MELRNIQGTESRVDKSLSCLTVDPEKHIGRVTLLVKSDPVIREESPPYFKRIILNRPVYSTLMDGSGRLWSGIIDTDDSLKEGDFITKTLLWVKENYIALR